MFHGSFVIVSFSCFIVSFSYFNFHVSLLQEASAQTKVTSGKQQCAMMRRLQLLLSICHNQFTQAAAQVL